VKTTPTLMSDLRRNDEFIGPDNRTHYRVTRDMRSHPRGWLDVRNLSMTAAQARAAIDRGDPEPGCDPAGRVLLLQRARQGPEGRAVMARALLQLTAAHVAATLNGRGSVPRKVAKEYALLLIDYRAGILDASGCKRLARLRRDIPGQTLAEIDWWVR
jgi:hypothetical protein